MKLEDINNKIKDVKNVPFLVAFLNHCKITNSPPPGYLPNINDIGAIGLNINSLYNNQTSNIIGAADAVYTNKTREELNSGFQTTGHATFVNLLTSNPQFSESMRDVFNAYQNGKLDIGTLTRVINNNMSDVYGDIYQRILNGENLDGRSINNLIAGGLIANGKNIRDETMLLTLQGVKLPKQAIEQRMEGIRWKPIKGGSLPMRDIEKIKKTTEDIKTTIEQAKTQLQTARSIVQILKMLESIYVKGYIGILEQISKKVFSIFRDIGSSGFYLLNMFEPYYIDGYAQNNYGVKMDEEGEKYKNLEENEKLMYKISRKKMLSNYEYLMNDFKTTTPYIADFTIQDFETLKTKAWSEVDADKFKKAFLESAITFYRPTTYASFIRTIADAFQDEGDLPGSQHNVTKIIHKGDLLDFLNPKPDIPGYIKRKGEDNQDTFRPGRPIFSDSSSSNVIVVAFSMPDFINLAATLDSTAEAILNFFGGLLSFETKKTETLEWFKDNLGSMKSLNRIFERFALRKRKRKLYDYLTKPPYLNSDGNPVLPDDNSEYPDFYGYTVRKFFPDLFQYVDEAEAEINKWTKDFKSSLSKSINRLLDNIDDIIDDLEDFVDLLDNIISFFEALQTMGLYTLSIISNGGNDDIVEKLLAAEGFPGVDEGDKLRFIGGFVICYGAPSPNLNGFDFTNFAKQKSALINYQAQVEKFTVSDNLDDDPGSFSDYMFDNNINGFDYNSSLDKIFKKIF